MYSDFLLPVERSSVFKSFFFGGTTGDGNGNKQNRLTYNSGFSEELAR